MVLLGSFKNVWDARRGKEELVCTQKAILHFKSLTNLIAVTGVTKNKYGDIKWWPQESVFANPPFMERPEGRAFLH